MHILHGALLGAFVVAVVTLLAIWLL